MKQDKPTRIPPYKPDKPAPKLPTNPDKPTPTLPKNPATGHVHSTPKPIIKHSAESMADTNPGPPKKD